MTEFVVVYVTVGSADEGERIASALVEERLAACVNRVGGVRSIYRWEGKVETAEEVLLIIKSRRDLFDRLKQRVAALHSYSVPEIVALPIVEGAEPYLKWLDEELAKK
ncbi:MAG TPA: divalent-cation tolerance protein CutA [Verrucomicrobiae bacterium]|jgi:periplasmic divalent cation tolerance protein|nr:divalent-cation tolerance protein CutA [Verrucomicrobiae bacterium]